jgi:diadenosine tetraphosphate (Ap4A) HIT family hydrolase
VDQETWDQIGEVCQELIQKMKSASFAGGFTIKCELNEKATIMKRRSRNIFKL